MLDGARMRALESLCAEHEVELVRLHIGFENIVSFPRSGTFRKAGP